MHTLKNWYAKRAGGRITVYGEERGEPVKIVGVDRIEPELRHVNAIDKNGVTHRLLINN